MHNIVNVLNATELLYIKIIKMMTFIIYTHIQYKIHNMDIVYEKYMIVYELLLHV